MSLRKNWGYILMWTVFACSVGFVLFLWSGLEIPPALLPPGRYDRSAIESRVSRLGSLRGDYLSEMTQLILKNKDASKRVMIDQRYCGLVDAIVGAEAAPEYLAMLAIWAETEDPWVSSSSDIYSIVFYRNVARLGQMKDTRASYALWKIRQSLWLEGHWDGHLAEAVEAAQERQR